MFFLKKILSRFLFPVPLALEFLIAGQILFWFTRRQKAGKTLVATGTLILGILSFSPVSTFLIRPLERRYRSLNVKQMAGIKAAFIVVLGGSGNTESDLPATSHVSPDLMVRLIEGVHLHMALPESKLILSGGSESALGMTTIAEELGVRQEDVLRLSEPRDTEEESKQIATLVRSQPFILVTSASHMPRAMGFFHKRGVQPIPDPTDYLAPRYPSGPNELIPDAYNLITSETAFYEYLGLAWEKLRGEI